MRTYETASGLPHLLKDGTDSERVVWCVYAGMVSGYRSSVEDIKTVMALRDAKTRGQEEMFRSLWKSKRAERLAWLTLTQRSWQKNTRRVTRAKHHDSISIREKYVRCVA